MTAIYHIYLTTCIFRWDITRSTFAGIDVLAVGARVLAQMRDEHVLRVLSQVVHDLVLGELDEQT